MIRIEPYKDEEVNDILKKLLINTEFLSFVEKHSLTIFVIIRLILGFLLLFYLAN